MKEVYQPPAIPRGSLGCYRKRQKSQLPGSADHCDPRAIKLGLKIAQA